MNRVLEPTTLSIEGMTCSSCVNTVEKALNAVEGVSASINFATETAHILAPADMDVKELVKIVEKAGYKVTYKVLNAVNFGVPQKRERVIILGTRNDIKFELKHPDPTHGDLENLFSNKKKIEKQ